MQAARIITRSTRLFAAKGIPSALSRSTTICARASIYNAAIKCYSTGSVDPRFDSLMAGITRGDKSIVRAELEKGDMNLNHKDEKSGTTALAAAVNGGFVEITRMLLVQGADVMGWVRPEDGNTLLHVAIKNGSEPISRLLVQYGAKLNMLNKTNETPLNYAIHHNRLGIVKALLKEGVKVAAVGAGEYPLNTVARTGNISIGKEILEAIFPANWRDSVKPNGETPIHIAAENGHGPMISYLATMPHSSALTARDTDKYTPLHIACERGHLAAVRALIGLNADQHVEQNTGNSPYELAKAKGHRAVTDFIDSLRPMPYPKPANWEEIVAAQAAAAAAAAAAPPPPTKKR